MPIDILLGMGSFSCWYLISWGFTERIHYMELQKNSHHVFRLMYHFVWIPKYRRKVFSEPYREAMKIIIQNIGYATEDIIRKYLQNQLVE
ncbi:transposase [Pseudoalteromonas sp. NBT06-2]|uniref:transposase n=1 Tax=Pseudoalteromonas sp. NBT06-2 TaxID=2025950 RepID=UPI00207623D6|nr:transposase [Pseudoalteromonas sp. NBT06-2]